MKKYLCICLPFCCALAAAQKPELVVQADGHMAEINQVCFSPDERQALSAGDDNRIVLWDLGSRKFVRFITTTCTPAFLCYTPNGRQAVAHLADSTLNAWSLETGQRVWKVKTPRGARKWFPRGDSLVVAFADNSTGCWSLTDGRRRWLKPAAALDEDRTFPPNLAGKIRTLGDSVRQVLVTPDNRTAVLALGIPTKFWSVTPGAPMNREGYGAIQFWDLYLDRPKHPVARLPESVNAIDLSGDGRRCLSAGSDRTVRLWDTRSGQELFRLERQPMMETNFQFTPDFRQMALTRFDGALKTWNLDQRSPMNFQIPTFANGQFASFPAANVFCFSPDGKQLLTGSRASSLTLLDAYTLDAVQDPLDRHACIQVATALDFSPDGKKCLVGSARESRVMYVSLERINRKDIRGYLKDAEGKTIGLKTGIGDVYGTPYDNPPEPNDNELTIRPDYFTVSLWDLEKGQSERVFPPYEQEDWNAADAVRFSPDGRTALARVSGRWSAWDISTGAPVQNAKKEKHFHAWQYGPDGGRALSIGDGILTQWRLDNGKIEKVYQNAEGAVAACFHPNGKKVLSMQTDGTLQEWNTATGALLRNIPLPFQNYEVELQYAPDSNFVLLRSRGEASVWDLTSGKNVLQLGYVEANAYTSTGIQYLGDNYWDGHSGVQVGLFEFLPDGRRAVSATYDGTLRFWDYTTGQEIATLHFPGENDWVVTTPSGLMDASPGAMQNMYYRVGTEVLELEQLKERYFEPGLLSVLLAFSNEPLRTVEGLDSVALYPRAALQFDTLRQKLGIRLAPRAGGVGKVSVFINGKEVIEDANPPRGFNQQRDTAFNIDLQPYARYWLSDSLNVISVRVYNSANWLKSAPQNVEFHLPKVSAKGGADGGFVPLRRSLKPALHILTVGTADYAGTQLDLKYPGKDARNMADALKQVGVELFGRDSVFVYLLTTDTADASRQPSKTNILAAFDQIRRKTKAEDIVAVYFSGHGVTYGEADKALFYYLTKDIASDNLSDAGLRAGRAISSEELTRKLNAIPAQKQVLILDACNSGKVVENLAVAGQKTLTAPQIRALDRMKDRTGLYILTGSTADKVSYEAGRYGQGLLTYSLLEGMSGLGLTEDKRVDVSTLFQYACDHVPFLAADIGGVQTPLQSAPAGGRSFDIGVVNARVKIPLAAVKPVFIRNNFQDDAFGDALDLNKALETHFRDLTAKGAQAELIYVDVSEYESAYSIRGRYSVKDNAVQLRGRLFKGKNAVGAEFKLAGRKDKIPALVEAIVDRVAEEIK